MSAPTTVPRHIHEEDVQKHCKVHNCVKNDYCDKEVATREARLWVSHEVSEEQEAIADTHGHALCEHLQSIRLDRVEGPEPAHYDDESYRDHHLKEELGPNNVFGSCQGYGQEESTCEVDNWYDDDNPFLVVDFWELLLISSY